jgi:hypothetical protein
MADIQVCLEDFRFCAVLRLYLVGTLNLKSKHGIINMVRAFLLSSYGAPTTLPHSGHTARMKPVAVIEEGRDLRGWMGLWLRGLSQCVQLLYTGAQVNFGDQAPFLL